MQTIKAPFSGQDLDDVFRKHVLMIKALGDQFPEPEGRKDMQQRFNLIMQKLNKKGV
jgi:hypothetical protein